MTKNAGEQTHDSPPTADPAGAALSPSASESAATGATPPAKPAAKKTAKKSKKKSKKKAAKKPGTKAKSQKPDPAAPPPETVSEVSDDPVTGGDDAETGGKKPWKKKRWGKNAEPETPAVKVKIPKVMGKGKKFVIVESPAKAKTINKYLGSGYVVKASIGHVRDLPKSKLGIDVENNFTPQYITIRGKKDVIKELKAYAAGATHVYLATDPDREGEAIAWHLNEALLLPKETTSRVTFNEITKEAIKRAFEHPRDIEQPLVDAYQARRALDRLVGYQISPILWRKISRHLSAGRVQSVAQRLICEREAEVVAFKPEEYWSISAYLMDAGASAALTDEGRQALRKAVAVFAGKDVHEALVDVDAPQPEGEAETTEPEPAPATDPATGEPVEGEIAAPVVKPTLPAGVFRADLKSWKGVPLAVTNKTDADAVHAALSTSAFTITKLETKKRQDRPRPPFITSTLQQAASSKLGFSARRTMRTAQGLYEGVDLGEEGATGLITYMRTDSVHISDFAMEEAREVIKGQFGPAYLPEERVLYKTSSKAQAAHEAIRPTSAFRSPDSIARFLNEDQKKLYGLIWNRFIACQMNPGEYDVTTVEITAGDGVFRAGGRHLLFDGHLRVSGRSNHDEQELPKLSENEKLECEVLLPDQHYTQPPSRFSEAGLVKTLEKLGIGRPSTYAAIISTIVDRGYVRTQGRTLFATELGQIVNTLLVNNFSRIVDPEFTAKMELQLDKIEEEKLDWVEVLRNFYEIFSEELAGAEERIATMKGQVATAKDGTPVPCPLCGGQMVVRWSKDGKFFGCAAYPECRGTLPVDADGNPIMLRKEDIECPKCTAPMVVRMSRRGPFLGCSEFPKCRGTRALEAAKTKEEKAAERQFAGLVCNKCGSDMGVRMGRGRPFLGCSAYPECRNAMSLKKAEAAIEAGEMKVDPERKEAAIAAMDAAAVKQEGVGAGVVKVTGLPPVPVVATA